MQSRSKSSLLYIFFDFDVYSVKVDTFIYIGNTSVLDVYRLPNIYVELLISIIFNILYTQYSSQKN